MAALADLEATLGAWRPDGVRRPVCVLMSGGVDSSVTAARLLDAGFDVVGLTLRLGTATGSSRPCCGLAAVEVCRRLGIAHHLADARAAFEQEVIRPFRLAYALGRTPSPCIDCNTFLKFGVAADLVRDRLGITDLATGHYARIEREGGETFLARAACRAKDQSYFLYGIPPALLPHLHLPLGGDDKATVRAEARARGLPTAERPESMELCFADGGDYRAALGPGDRPGDIVDTDGRVLGRHPGVRHFTVGQRKGLGVAHTAPLHVVRLDPVQAQVVVGERHQALRRRVEARSVRHLQPGVCQPGATLRARLRSAGEPAPCTVVVSEGEVLAVEFAEPVFAPAPGQHLVLYDQRDRVVAGGVITGSSA